MGGPFRPSVILRDQTLAKYSGHRDKAVIILHVSFIGMSSDTLEFCQPCAQHLYSLAVAHGQAVCAVGQR